MNQYPLIVGFAGLARSGKDTASEALSDWRRLKFADGVYEGYLKLDPLIEVGLCSFMRLSDAVEKWGWEYLKENSRDVRRGLQRYGTEAGREIHGENCWVNALLRKMMKEFNSGVTRFRITDVRFPNEYEPIKKHGGIVLGIVRPGVTRINNHISESFFDQIHDRLILNDGSIAELHHKVTVAVQEHYHCSMKQLRTAATTA